MNPIVFALTFTVGCGALAAWFDVRFPRFTPDDMKPILLHAMGAMVALQFTAAALDFGAGSHVGTLAAVFAVGLPALTYAFLVGLWTVKLMSGAVRGLPR